MKRAIILVSVFIWTLSLGVCSGVENESKDAAEWAQAEKTFIAFVTPILQNARKRLNDPQIQWAQVRHDLLRKYLPDIRLYIRDGTYTSEDMIWLVTREGKITPLGDGIWTGVGGDQYFGVAKVSDYVKSRRIKVESAEQGVEVARLIEVIAGSPNYVGMLRRNTNNYTVFDDRFLRSLYGSRDNWKYSATKKETGWEVKVDYIGPPAAIPQPPTYELVLDEHKQFADLRRQSRVR